MVDEIDAAIVKYHEVSVIFLCSLPPSCVSSWHCLYTGPTTPRVTSFNTQYVCRGIQIRFLIIVLQALSVDPINGHVLELLNLALEASSNVDSFTKKALPSGGGTDWAKKMSEQRDKGRAKLVERAGPGDDDTMGL